MRIYVKKPGITAQFIISPGEREVDPLCSLSGSIVYLVNSKLVRDSVSRNKKDVLHPSSKVGLWLPQKCAAHLHTCVFTHI